MSNLGPSHLLDPEEILASLEPIFARRRRLQRVRVFVHGNFREANLESCSRVACMNPASFSRFFSRSVGMTFSSWLRLERANRAAELLGLDAEVSISHVAWTVGLRHPRSLARLFRDVFGLPPTTYRSGVRQARSRSPLSSSVET